MAIYFIYFIAVLALGLICIVIGFISGPNSILGDDDDKEEAGAKKKERGRGMINLKKLIKYGVCKSPSLDDCLACHLNFEYGDLDSGDAIRACKLISNVIAELKKRMESGETDDWKCDNCKKEIRAGEIYYSPKRLPFLKRKKYCEKCDFGGYGYVRVINNKQYRKASNENANS